MINVSVEGDGRAVEMLNKIADALTPEKIDGVIEGVATETFAHLVQETPKKWFGSVRAGWEIEKPEPGVRLLINRNKVMGFLEFGTASEGTGFIYPKTAKALYIPLTRQAAGGYHEGLKFGVDFVLAKKVRGIKPRKIVEKERLLVQQRLETASVAYLKEVTGT